MFEPPAAEPIFTINVKQWRTNYRSGYYPVPNLSDATLEAEYSFDFQKGLLPNSQRHLRAFRTPKLGTDLFDGIEEGVSHKRSDLLRRILEYPDECGLKLSNFELITGRICLSTIASALYCKDPILLLAQKTDEGPVDMWTKWIQKPKPKSVHIEKSIHAGWSFEKAATADDGESQVGQGKYFALVARQLGNQRLLFCAEMDCCQQDPGSMDDFVELKALYKPVYDGRRTQFYLFKAPRIWFQCFIAGIERLVFGLFNDDGSLVKVEEESPSRLSERALNHLQLTRSPKWDKDEILTFVSYTLNLVHFHSVSNPGRRVRMTCVPNGKTHELVAVLEEVPEKQAIHSSGNKRDWHVYVRRSLILFLTMSGMLWVARRFTK